MWPAKMPGEGAALYDACKAMCDLMKEFGIAVDGGKDSLSMVARDGRGEAVKAPGALVVSCYAPCPDISQVRLYSTIYCLSVFWKFIQDPAIPYQYST
jgi:phosphoribosylformylglycinamidine synthase